MDWAIVLEISLEHINLVVWGGSGWPTFDRPNLEPSLTGSKLGTTLAHLDAFPLADNAIFDSWPFGWLKLQYDGPTLYASIDAQFDAVDDGIKVILGHLKIF